MSQLRIAQIAPLFESVPPKLYGGTERVVHNLTAGLVAAGADVTVFASGDSSPFGKLEAMCPRALRLQGKLAHQCLAYQLKVLSEVADRARDGEFDLIHNHYDYPLMALTKLAEVPVVSTIHNRLDRSEADLEGYRAFSSAPLVSISSSQRQALPSLNWVATIFHGLDIGAYAYTTRRSGGQYLAFLGRLSRDKRPDWAIQIAKSSGIPLKIAAKIDEEDPGYYNDLLKPQIDGHFIEYVGEIHDEEKLAFLGNALGLVFPIDWPEPFGLVMIEAMACGTPILTRPVGSVPEIMLEGVTGFVRHDIGELARLAPQLENLDRDRIRRYFERRFSVERMTQEYLHVYRELIEQERPSARARSYKSQKLRRMAEYRRNIIYPVDSTPDGNSQGIAEG